MLFSKVHAQEKKLVANQGITSAIHQANLGKLFFSVNAVSIAEPEKAVFLEAYELTNKSNLYITFFMDNSMTNYLHQLEPLLSADQLVQKGNYQFSFYVDRQLIYKTELLPGAPRALNQDTETALSKPLISDNSLWSNSMWGRFMRNGGDSILTDGRHLLRIEVRPYINHSELKVGKLIASGQLNLNVKRKAKINISGISLSAVKPYPGLGVSADAFNKARIRELKGSINEGVFKHITSIVVIKNGKILIEEYFNGATRDSLHDPRSVGKSFAGTVTGLAIKDGYLKDENQSLKEFYDLKSFANYAIEKENCTIKDLLTMNSVFDGDDEDSKSLGNEDNMYPTTDWIKFVLDLPVNPSAKSKWHYFTAGVVLLGDILNKSVPGGLETYANEKLFKPLGITNYKWEYTPQKVPNTAGGIRMSALDFAKYGQLYKNGGRWKGRQIIPKDWVNASFTKQLQIQGRSNEFYGYLFWNKTYKVKGKAYETFYCAGNGGNKIFVFKDQPLVVVITATAYGAMYSHTQVDKMMEDFILPSVLSH